MAKKKKIHIRSATKQESTFPVIKTMIQHTLKHEIEPDHKKIVFQKEVGYAATQ